MDPLNFKYDANISLFESLGIDEGRRALLDGFFAGLMDSDLTVVQITKELREFCQTQEEFALAMFGLGHWSGIIEAGKAFNNENAN